MNAVEIDQAIQDLIQRPYVRDEFPYAFLEAFGNKATTIKKLQSGVSNASDIVGAVLQRSHIHIATCDKGSVQATLAALRDSPKTRIAKAKFILATDGEFIEAEDLISGEAIACSYPELYQHFGFFLPLAGINTVREIRDNPIDIQATSRLNRLYLELLKENPDWGTDERRHDLNQLMTRLIFCFFAEDTGIFPLPHMFTQTIEQMSDVSNTHEVVAEIFKAMDIAPDQRVGAKLRPWADKFPYVNGGLYGGSKDIPQFSRAARSYLLHAGRLDWKQINPDIFGSMIQAVADEEERGALGMHYTSVPNILKVLNPLFLDDLRQRLEECHDNARMLLNLRKRLSKIRVFDPACGSGNFLVIAYKEMRKIEAEINSRRDEAHLRSEIPLNNFRGIELRNFSAEIARLALIIAEYQCDVLYRGQKDAIADFLPLDSMNWITCDNALKLDWVSVFPASNTTVKLKSDDLFNTPLDQAEIDFENEGGETYICGNPPYLGSQSQSEEQKADLKNVFDFKTTNWKSLDYVTGWFMKAAEYGKHTGAETAFVATNSICQGRQIGTLWPLIFKMGIEIKFAHTSFKWSNLASYNAGVTVVIIGLSNRAGKNRQLFSIEPDGETTVKSTSNINAYLISASNIEVIPRSMPVGNINSMEFGSMPNDGGFLLLSSDEYANIPKDDQVALSFVRPFYGSYEFINGIQKKCIWITKSEAKSEINSLWLKNRFDEVRKARLNSKRGTTRSLANLPYSFGEIRQNGDEQLIIVPRVSSERRYYLPAGLLNKGSIVSDAAFMLLNAPLWNLALLASRLHLVWIATVCGKLKTDFRYSNTLGWNTFPIPTLTEKNKADLTRCAEDILLARETHFPATIAELYDVENMPADLKEAHERNDEVLERIYIGRCFKNDTERLERLFELYVKLAASTPVKSVKLKRKAQSEPNQELDL